MLSQFYLAFISFIVSITVNESRGLQYTVSIIEIQ